VGQSPGVIRDSGPRFGGVRVRRRSGEIFGGMMIEEKWGDNTIVLLDDYNADGEPKILAIAKADPKRLPSGRDNPRRKFTIEIRTQKHPEIEVVKSRCVEFITERM
jgi:hypothetical protein